ncbi:MAG: thioesterase [Kiritimatiellaceae bacterium]|nr:thioesterase [Kiritimatiellaceae bacterium]
MSRAIVDLPEQFSFSTDITIRITDINYGGHLGNADVLALMHEARVLFLQSFGYSETSIEGFGCIMLDSVVLYKAQAFAGDVLRIEVAAGDFNRIGFDLYYRITNAKTGASVVSAKTGMAIYDYVHQKRISPPAAFVDKLQGAASV